MQVWPSQEVSLSGKRTAFICQETSLDQVGSVPMSASPQGLVVQFWIAVFSSPLMFAPCSFSVLPAASTNRVPSTRTLSPVVPLALRLMRPAIDLTCFSVSTAACCPSRTRKINAMQAHSINRRTTNNAVWTAQQSGLLPLGAYPLATVMSAQHQHYLPDNKNRRSHQIQQAAHTGIAQTPAAQHIHQQNVSAAQRKQQPAEKWRMPPAGYHRHYKQTADIQRYIGDRQHQQVERQIKTNRAATHYCRSNQRYG